jgi:hypothetical protein
MGAALVNETTAASVTTNFKKCISKKNKGSCLRANREEEEEKKRVNQREGSAAQLVQNST